MKTRDQVSRRDVLRLGVGGAVGLLAAATLGACQSSTPAAPTTQSAPAPTAAAPAPAAPTSQPAATAAVKPATAPAKRLRFVYAIEPTTYDPKDEAGDAGGAFDIYETLTHLDAKTAKVGPRLALSWEQKEPTVWRFTLRKGVQFTNGEPFTAEAVRSAVSRAVHPDAPVRRYMGDLVEARPVDDHTVDLVTKQADPTLPHRLIFLLIPAPKWIQSTKPDEVAITAVGTGPLKLVEWKKGQHVLLAANESYWGEKARVAEVQILSRKEASVRADMVVTGEADIAHSINYEDAKRVPKAVRASNVRVQGIRINTKHPVLKDVRVRKAMAMAIDTKTIAETIYLGMATPANGQLVNATAVGWNPDLKPYPYDPEQAKKLLTEAGAVGTELTLLSLAGGYFQRDQEQLEAIVQMLNKAGLKVKLQLVESAKFWGYYPTNTAGAPQSDLLHVQHGNDLMDSELTLNSYYTCSAANTQFCDPKLDELVKKGVPLGGDARAKAFQEAWAYAYDQYPWIYTLNVEWLEAVGKNVDWTPRLDGIMYYSAMGLTS